MSYPETELMLAHLENKRIEGATEYARRGRLLELVPDEDLNLIRLSRENRSCVMPCRFAISLMSLSKATKMASFAWAAVQTIVSTDPRLTTLSKGMIS